MIVTVAASDNRLSLPIAAKYVKLRRSDVLTQTICHTLNGLFLLKTKYNMSRAWNFMHFQIFWNMHIILNCI